jgi:cytoskeletal protein CcmA (bactofilin family)
MAKWRLRSADVGDGSEIVSLIGEGTAFTGDLVLSGGARVDGKVVGRITAHSLLVVGPSGDIDAQELRAHSVTVCGNLRGKLVVHERLEIQPGGRVSGQLVMEREGLVVAPGGLFEGTVEYVREIVADEPVAREFALEATV